MSAILLLDVKGDGVGSNHDKQLAVKKDAGRRNRGPKRPDETCFYRTMEAIEMCAIGPGCGRGGRLDWRGDWAQRRGQDRVKR